MYHNLCIYAIDDTSFSELSRVGYHRDNQSIVVLNTFLHNKMKVSSKKRGNMHQCEVWLCICERSLFTIGQQIHRFYDFMRMEGVIINDSMTKVPFDLIDMNK